MRKNAPFMILVVSALIVSSWLLFKASQENVEPTATEQEEVAQASASVPSERLATTFADVELSQSLVPFDQILWGGVSKDGIPAISEPEFDPLSSS